MAQVGQFRLTKRRLWLLGLSGLVALFLTACALLTLQVYFQLDEYRSTEADDISYTVTRLEVDHARLLAAAQAVSLSPETVRRQSLEDLRRRFDALYSRVGILREGEAYRQVWTGEADVALREITGRLDQLLPLMDGGDGALTAATPRVETLVQLMAQDVGILSRAGVALDVARVEARREDLTDKLMELAVLSALMLAAMIALLIQLWNLYTRYRRRALDNRATLQRVSTILNTALDTIVVVDGQSRIVDANATAEATLDLRDPDGRLKPINTVLLRQSDDTGTAPVPVPVTGEMLIGSCRDGPNRCSKLLARRKSGENFPVEMSADIAWQDGRQVCVCYFRDISRRLETEAEIRAARDRALAGEKAQARFLGMISHEMRTPLNGILGTLDLLEDTDLNAEQQRYARIIQSAGQQLLTQINDALDLTQAGAGKLSLNSAPFDLDALLEEALAGQFPLAEAMDTKLEIRRQAGPLGVVVGDRARVMQVLVNLLSNAVKFTRGGEVTIEAVRPDPAASLIEVQVVDTGCGIDETDLPRIFDDFVRVSHEDDEAIPGTGLGLGIVRELVTAMGGDVGAESIPGEGSLFWVSLPLPRAASGASAVQDASVRTAKASGTSPVPPLDILVADDNDANRFVLSEMLRKDGHKVQAVSDGLEAVEAAEARAFDLIVTDIRMPRLDGIAAARKIRGGKGASRDARLVFLTAHIDSDAPGQFRGLDVEAVLPKPLRRKALRETLAGTLGDEALHDQTSTGPVDAQVLGQLRDTLRPPVFAELLGRFIEEGDGFIARLPALREGPAEELIAAIHHFAGSAATFGAVGLQSALGTAESALYAKDDQRAAATLERLPDIWRETLADLQDQRSAA